MLVGWLVVLAVAGFFGLVTLFGAPYLPSRRRQIEAALDLLNLKEGQTLLELGCGDGRVLKVAAKRGLVAVGYELNPILVVVARANTFRYRSKVRVVWGNYWHQTWPKADGIFVFLITKYMAKLHKQIVQYRHKPIKLASFAFKVPNLTPNEAKQGVYLYVYK